MPDKHGHGQKVMRNVPCMLTTVLIEHKLHDPENYMYIPALKVVEQVITGELKLFQTDHE